MRVLKAIFSVLTIVFGSLGLINIVSTDITFRKQTPLPS